VARHNRLPPRRSCRGVLDVPSDRSWWPLEAASPVPDIQTGAGAVWRLPGADGCLGMFIVCQRCIDYLTTPINRGRELHNRAAFRLYRHPGG
jgi:hypothetical protein